MRTIKLWQLLIAILVVGITLGLIPSQRVALITLLCIEVVLVTAIIVITARD